MLMLLGFCAAAWAQAADLSPELLLLSRIKSKMAETLRRQPNYTCVQRIERSQRLVPRQRFELVDMLRLEVALVDGHEMFAWPGSKKFEDTELSRMVSGGAIGNGNFALHARAVFMAGGPVFSFRGEDKLEGRRALRFDFQVSLLNSGYRIRVNDREAVVAYNGSFWADPGTSDVMRLEIHAEDIPESLGLRSANDRMDYVRIKIGASDFLLPSGSELTMVDLNGNENRNRVRFASCRQYTGESVLSFSGSSATEAVNPPADDPPQALPGGLYAEIRLETPIDSDQAMVGDPVEVTLDQPLRHKRQLLKPRGATLTGRIVRIDRRHGDSLLDLQFTEAKSERTRWTLMARVDEIRLPGFGSSVDRPEKSIFTKPASQLGTIYRRGGNIHLPRGTHMTLRTQNIAAGGDSRSAPAQEKQ